MNHLTSPAELEARLRLHALPELGPRRFRRLLQAFETASAALALQLSDPGKFANEEELARLALSEFLRHHSFERQEQFQRDDIQWALSLKPGKP